MLRAGWREAQSGGVIDLCNSDSVRKNKIYDCSMFSFIKDDGIENSKKLHNPIGQKNFSLVIPVTNRTCREVVK
jgi:hypothetical protein